MLPKEYINDGGIDMNSLTGSTAGLAMVSKTPDSLPRESECHSATGSESHELLWCGLGTKKERDKDKEACRQQ
jgi:hypothetical protein